jgi:hypothetical protein
MLQRGERVGFRVKKKKRIKPNMEGVQHARDERYGKCEQPHSSGLIDGRVTQGRPKRLEERKFILSRQRPCTV